jgi:hypothetical protein
VGVIVSTLFDEASSDDERKIAPDELLVLWNAAAKQFGMRGAHGMGDVGSPRYRRVKALLKAHPSRAYWQDVIERITKSGFCRGDVAGSDGRTWRADFDFLTRLDTHLKVLEGKYDDDTATLGNDRGRGRARVYDESIASLPMRRISGGHE